MEQSVVSSDIYEYPKSLLGSKVRLLEESLLCQICEDFINNPHSLRCGHTFCSECIRRHLDRNHNNVTFDKCPVCFEKADSTHLFPNRPLSAIVSNFQLCRNDLLNLLKGNAISNPNLTDAEINNALVSSTNNHNIPADQLITKQLPQKVLHKLSKARIKSELVTLTSKSTVDILTEGTERELEKRYQDFIILHNSQINSIKPLSFTECVREINRREKAKAVEGKLLSVSASLHVEKMKIGEVSAELDYKFTALVKQAKKRAREQQQQHTERDVDRRFISASAKNGKYVPTVITTDSARLEIQKSNSFRLNDWKLMWSEKANTPFFYNEVTKIGQFAVPEELADLPFEEFLRPGAMTVRPSINLDEDREGTSDDSIAADALEVNVDRECTELPHFEPHSQSSFCSGNGKTIVKPSRGRGRSKRVRTDRFTNPTTVTQIMPQITGKEQQSSLSPDSHIANTKQGKGVSSSGEVDNNADAEFRRCTRATRSKLSQSATQSGKKSPTDSVYSSQIAPPQAIIENARPTHRNDNDSSSVFQMNHPLPDPTAFMYTANTQQSPLRLDSRQNREVSLENILHDATNSQYSLYSTESNTLDNDVKTRLDLGSSTQTENGYDQIYDGPTYAKNEVRLSITDGVASDDDECSRIFPNLIVSTQRQAVGLHHQRVEEMSKQYLFTASSPESSARSQMEKEWSDNLENHLLISHVEAIQRGSDSVAANTASRFEQEPEMVVEPEINEDRDDKELYEVSDSDDDDGPVEVVRQTYGNLQAHSQPGLEHDYVIAGANNGNNFTNLRSNQTIADTPSLNGRSWSCPTCTFENLAINSRCAICDNSRYFSSQSQSSSLSQTKNSGINTNSKSILSMFQSPVVLSSSGAASTRTSERSDRSLPNKASIAKSTNNSTTSNVKAKLKR